MPAWARMWIIGMGLVCFAALYAVAKGFKQTKTRYAVCAFLLVLIGALIVRGLWN